MGVKERAPKNDKAGEEQEWAIERELRTRDRRPSLVLAVSLVMVAGEMGKVPDRKAIAREDYNLGSDRPAMGPAWGSIDETGAGQQSAKQGGAGRWEMSQAFQPLHLYTFSSCRMTEWRKAVAVSQGMKLAFSTGSHPQ